MYKAEINQKESTFFTNYTLVEKVEDKSVVSTISYLINRIIEQKQLDENLIREIKTHYNRKNRNISIEIDYYKFNPEELKSMPVKEQIHTVLLKMGYSESDIRCIEYRKFWSNSDEKVWVAEVYDSDYNEALNEPDSHFAREFSGSLMCMAEKALGFTLYFDFY